VLMSDKDDALSAVCAVIIMQQEDQQEERMKSVKSFQGQVFIRISH
jgi:hypothetical protein